MMTVTMPQRSLPSLNRGVQSQISSLPFSSTRYGLRLVLVLLAVLAAGGAIIGIGKAYVGTAPTLDLALLSDQDKTSFIYDSDGVLITDYKGTENRVMVNIYQIPEQLQYAFIAIEDVRFFAHSGVDFKRIIGSFIKNFVSNSNQGGSTITQQLIKNTILSSELSYKRKIQEAYLAMQLETTYTKAEILESYLNTIYLGENYYGVSVAAEGYFGKKLSPILRSGNAPCWPGWPTAPITIIRAGTFIYANRTRRIIPALTNNRTDYVLQLMYENEFITYEDYQNALNPDSAYVTETSTIEGEGMYSYAHYVEYAVKEVVDCFLELNGLEDTSENRYKMENELRTGGYHVTLAIDSEIQEIVEDTLENWTDYPSLRDPSDKIYRAKNEDGTYTEITQAAGISRGAGLPHRRAHGDRRQPYQAHAAQKRSNRATDMNMPVGLRH